MTTEAEPLDTSEADMSAFVARYGVEGALDGLQDKQEKAASDQTPAPSNHESVPDDEPDDDLDAATLQALGLTPEDPPSPEGEQEKGTEEPSLDLGSLAKTLGVDEQDLTLEGGQLKIRTKVDGEEDLTPFAKLREGYQLRQHFTRQNEEFLEQKRQWESAKQQEMQRTQQLAEAAGQVLGSEEQALKAQYTRDWTQLRQDDPAEYAAQVAEYNQKLQDIRSRGQQVFSQLQQQQQQMQQQMLDQQRQIQAEGSRKLAEALQWKDKETYETGAKRLHQYLTDVVGLTREEVAMTTDYRSLVVTDKARRYDELMAKVDLARKKVNGSHKIPSGSNPKPTAGGKQRKAQESIKRLQKEQSVDAAADAFRNLGII